jgi:hypothetical protein
VFAVQLGKEIHRVTRNDVVSTGHWRGLHIEELQQLSVKMRWGRNVACTENRRNAYNVLSKYKGRGHLSLEGRVIYKVLKKVDLNVWAEFL